MEPTITAPTATPMPPATIQGKLSLDLLQFCLSQAPRGALEGDLRVAEEGCSAGCLSG